MCPRPCLTAASARACLVVPSGCGAESSFAQTPLNERVLVVYNSNAADSLERSPNITWPSAKFRRRTGARSPVSSTDIVDQREFESRVKTPVRHCLEAVGVQKILYIVFSFHTPYTLHAARSELRARSIRRRHLG